MADSSTPQPADTGSGPHIERRYYIDLEAPAKSAAELMKVIQCDVEHFSPDLLANFEKRKGEQGRLRVGDEFHIKILGPWNGSVRVTEVSPQHFELLTLEGHPEAGRIRFSTRQLPKPAGALRFEIHSRARSRDGLVAFAYSTIGVGKQVQEQTWVTFCQRVAEASGGRPLGPVQVETVEQDGSDKQTERHERA
ncbi:DUF1990 family protein [Hymenobacter busanensis]|uniref:DUF1990 family protein n=1 Tax=Hymenobacter busanensis TaxID=2607656 RepID=A0A7L4ZXQ6_9BACT|nr:DUF1990 family protein [Hymenobacter busanensis]KAA9332057.1 DUF1990 family protein [Hymenobacter busanensis]QHJ07605.1 DUF1990 family protein [Hymenobacter busanensis]